MGGRGGNRTPSPLRGRLFSKQLRLKPISVALPKWVGVVGFEPTQPEGNRFTVCRSSPTLPYPHVVPSVGLEPTRPCDHQYLKLAGLPFPHEGKNWCRVGFTGTLRSGFVFQWTRGPSFQTPEAPNPPQAMPEEGSVEIQVLDSYPSTAPGTHSYRLDDVSRQLSEVVRSVVNKEVIDFFRFRKNASLLSKLA